MTTIESFRAEVQGDHLYVSVTRAHPVHIDGISWEVSLYDLVRSGALSDASLGSVLTMIQGTFPVIEVSSGSVVWRPDAGHHEGSMLDGFVIDTDDVGGINPPAPWKRIAEIAH